MSQQRLLSASDILDAEDLITVYEEVPEWKGTVILRQMNAEESLAWTKDVEAYPTDGMYVILIRSLYAPDGVTRLFTVEDIPRLRKKNIKVLDRLQRICLRINGMGPKAEAELKNASGEAASADSPLTSPATLVS